MGNSPQVTFIARHYPPSPNINGESIWDIVVELEETHGIHSRVITIDRSFDGGGGSRKPAGEVIRLKTPYSGKNPIIRFVTFLYDGWKLTKEALKYKDSFLMFTTSPPLLPMWASIFLGRKNVRWGVWYFDLFPEGFAASNQIKQTNPLFKLAKKYTYHYFPDLIIALGKKQSKCIQTNYQNTIHEIILPCGIFLRPNVEVPIPEWYDSTKIILGYCGAISNSHNPLFIKYLIDAIDPVKHKLILALFGPFAEEVKNYAQGKRGIVIVESVPRNQLKYIDIHGVTLRNSWTHIAVLSKAVSAVTMGSAFIFCGSAESDNWDMLQEAGWFIDESKDIAQQLKSQLASIDHKDIVKKKLAAQQITIKLQELVKQSYQEFASLIKKN